MRKVRSIEEIYRELEGCGMVVTNQAPLATALNRIADRPMVGRFAVTPRKLAQRLAVSILGEETWSDARIVSFIAESTGLEMRYVHGEVENIRDVRRHTSQVERHLDGRDAELVWKHLDRLPTVERAMERFPLDFFEGIDVAVVAVELFDELDKHVLPPPGAFRDISPWGKGSFSFERILDMGNERLMGRHVADLIDESNMNATAVVMDSEGSLAEALRTSLFSKGIPFQSARRMRDLPGVRDMLRFLELSLQLPTVRMRDVRGAVRAISLEGLDTDSLRFDNRDDGRLFHMHAGEDDSPLGSLLHRMREVSEMTLSQAARSLLKDQELTLALRLLREMDINDQGLSLASLETFRYGVDRLSTDILRDEDEREGVVLVDCRSSAYVDRPIVFHLGLGNEWARRIPRRRHIDSEAELDKDQARFEILLQQGEQRMYMTSKVAKGRKVVPCAYFNRALQRPVRDFDDLVPQGGHTDGRWIVEEDGSWEGVHHDVEPVMPASHSPSGLNQFLRCPRRYHFSRLCSGADSAAAYRGTLVHSYAELLSHHPRYASDEGLETCLSVLQRDFVKLSHEGRDRQERTALRALMRNAAEFLRHYELQDDGGPPSRGNPLFKALGETPRISNTEIRLEDRGMMLRGMLDLKVNDSLAVDHKSGMQQSARTKAKAISAIWDDGNPDAQPLAYLALLLRNGELRREVSLHFNHLKPVPEDMQGYELANHLQKVTYIGTGRSGMVSGRNPWIVRILRDKRKDFNAFLDEVGDLEFCEFLRSIKAWDLNPEDLEARQSELTTFLKGRSRKRAVGRDIFKRAVEELQNAVPYLKDNVLVTEDVMQRFLDEVKVIHGQIEAYKRDGFPARPRKDSECKRCDYLDVCLEARE